MARSTYISDNLTHSQMDVMRMLDENEIEIFSLDALKEMLGDQSEDVNEIVENLVHKQIIARIERGKYCRIHFRDEKVIGCFLVPDGAIAYWSALNIHGLTEQFPNAVFIQTASAKQNKAVFGVDYKFIKVKSAKRTGIESQGYGNHKYRITDREKTIIDCFDLPQHSGGYAELIRAYFRTDTDEDKMIKYCRAIDNISVVKRLAFLTELFGKPGMSRFMKYALDAVNPRYVLFDPFGGQEGAFNSKWKLRLNITTDEILDICNKQY